MDSLNTHILNRRNKEKDGLNTHILNRRNRDNGDPQHTYT